MLSRIGARAGGGRRGFAVAASLIIASSMVIGAMATIFLAGHKEKARDENASHVMRSVVSLVNATTRHYADFIAEAREELRYYLENGTEKPGAQTRMAQAWDSSGAFDVRLGEDIEETSAEYIERLGLEDIDDPEEEKFVDGCTVTTTVSSMTSDYTNSSFPLDYIPSQWHVVVNLKCAPGYFYDTEAMRRASASSQTFGADLTTLRTQGINIIFTKMFPDEIEVRLTYMMQLRQSE